MFKKLVDEAAYVGNVGMMELLKFHKIATPGQKKSLKTQIGQKKTKEAWQMVQKITGTKLHKSVHEDTHPDIMGPKGAGNDGTKELVNSYLKDTPGHQHLVGKKPTTFKGFISKRHK